MTAAYEETRIALRKTAERNKRYYDARVRSNEYKVGSWVYYYNPRKFKGRQDKWERTYSGPFLVIASPSAVTVRLQRTKGSKPFIVHVDKVKPYLTDKPKSWIGEAPAIEVSELQSENTESAKGAEEVNEPEENLPTDGTEAAYAVDDAPPRTRPKRESRRPAHLKNYVHSIRRETEL